jgi:hypothetical protein
MHRHDYVLTSPSFNTPIGRYAKLRIVDEP